jgi:hypothetical protein
MAEALEGETDGVDEVDAGADEGIAQFEAEQIVLGLGRTVLDGMKQGRVNAGKAGEHLGIALVAFAFVTRDGVELARVGDQDVCAEVGEVTADPRAVRAGFEGNGGAGEIGEQLGQCGPGVGQCALADDLAGGIEDADMMRPVSEIKAEGEPADDSRREGGNDRSCCICFHRQSV